MKNIINHIKKLFIPIEMYDDIENIPLFNYWNIMKDGDLKYLIKGPIKRGFTPDEYSNALINWNKVNGSYVDFFGVSANHKEMLEIKKEIIVNEYIWVTRKEPIAKVYAREAKKMLDKMTDSSEESSLEDQVFFVEKEMGFEVNPKKITVKKFYSYIKSINQHAKNVSNG
jgi:hypothetical protein